MDDPEPVVDEPADQILEWVDELLLEIEVSLAKHAEFVRLYPD